MYTTCAALAVKSIPFSEMSRPTLPGRNGGATQTTARLERKMAGTARSDPNRQTSPALPTNPVPTTDTACPPKVETTDGVTAATAGAGTNSKSARRSTKSTRFADSSINDIPEACAGAAQRARLADTTAARAERTPPKRHSRPGENPVPRTSTSVPPDDGASDGNTPLTIGTSR